jgi:glycosyltransferase involved in cell wall biosynthesis
LHRELGFDVAHHVTLASYWTRAGVSVLPIPLVLGPIGGGVDPPLRLLSELGIRGLIEATARIVGRPAVAMRPSVRRTHKLAAVILAQNIDTARRLRAHGRTTLLSNAFAVDLDDVFDRDARTKELLFVGRLLPWKAPILALRSFRYVQDPAAVLRFFGNGREQPRLERAAERWRLADRISFEGWVPRRELLSSVVRAGVLIHPAVHEEAGLCIAEALMLGTPIVALDHGGPSEIVGQWRGTPSALVLARGPDATAHSIAASVDRFLAAPPPVPTKPVRASTSFAGSILHAYDLAVRLARRAEQVGETRTVRFARKK